nr:PD40 domain-containing protein [Candidatus Dependentiae bacterium]
MQKFISIFLITFILFVKALYSEQIITADEPELFIGSPDNELFFAGTNNIESSGVCAFVSNAEGFNNIYLRKKNEGLGFITVKLTSNPYSDNSDPVFSYDGTVLAFTTNRTDAGGNIELIKFDTNYNIISRNEIILNETIEFMPVFSSDGNFLFFCQKDKKSISVTETKIKKINL